MTRTPSGAHSLTRDPTDHSRLSHRLRALVDGKTKPLGSLGRLEDLAVQLGTLQGTTTPSAARCLHTIIAADHGIAAEGVSAYPAGVTRLMLATFLDGRAAASVFARVVGAEVRVVDAGVSGPPLDHPRLVSRRIGSGTANSVTGPAMTPDQCRAALDAGLTLGAEADTDIASFGEMGIANTSAASLVCATVLGLPVASLVGRGTGIDDDSLARKRAVLERVVARVARAADITARTSTGGVQLPAEQALTEVGGFEIAMMAGAMLGAARSNRLVLVDGFVAGAAAVAALDIDPSLRSAFVFAHRSAEAGHAAVLEALGADPLLDLGLRLGEGTGALLAVPLLQSAAAMLTGMADLEDLGIEPG
ncbi:nicotinate-nucleotide--dimethylbenzimidazole phosphoribosyltransferase [Phycicoccus avicenniae]|uniref:nicotinate-nucleotide--dimethylbenzimidazole phosphoribosyltransferase n=1 Tax=Phycicoccus avicenniae TaxID=2828860 RepID=UPI003D2CD6B9